MVYAAVILMGGLGALSRYMISSALVELGGWVGTFMVNILGAMAIGAASVFLNRGQPDWVQIGVVAGFLGGFTTFSAFSLEVWKMIDGGRWIWGALYACASVLICVLSVSIGRLLCRFWLGLD